MSKKLNESLQKQIDYIQKRLWILENPQKFNKGDEVEYHIVHGKTGSGVVIDIEFCDKYLGLHWIYTVWETGKMETTKYYDWDKEYLNAEDRKGWIRKK
jgi:hypothetical protein